MPSSSISVVILPFPYSDLSITPAPTSTDVEVDQPAKIFLKSTLMPSLLISWLGNFSSPFLVVTKIVLVKVSLLSGIVFAYLKITKNCQEFCPRNTRKARKQEKRFGKIAFFRFFRFFRRQIFLVFKAIAIFNTFANFGRNQKTELLKTMGLKN